MSHIIDAAALVLVAWIAHRQERVRRSLDDFNGQVHEQLSSINEKLPDPGDAGPDSKT